jgi:hypothetical protein
MVSEANQNEIEAAGLSCILTAPHARCSQCLRPVAPRASRRGGPRRARVHLAVAGRPGRRAP